ncbi:Uncharacterized protein OBRU01_08000 [Operophtera brumata]|uniref:HMA domain-containing protein n=1 Tax=Operophtera brumata TaxID=104452 RepID=A0A0L7L6H7_OPEBR|nr:Uncharacterized protein OBRU01_08000 [Operophtera brumata]
MFPLVHRESNPDLVAVRVPINGMTCQSCVRSIEGSVKELPGVAHVKVELSEQAGYFRYDPRATSVEALREHIEDMGFEVPAGLADEETRSVPHTCLMELSEQAPSDMTLARPLWRRSAST